MKGKSKKNNMALDSSEDQGSSMHRRIRPSNVLPQQKGEMYADTILDYYRNPRNFGTIKNAEIKARDLNPVCGDEIEINAKLNGRIVKDIKFSGRGCAISQAAAGMLTEMSTGKKLEDLAKLGKQDILNALGIPLSPARIKCALLPLKVLKLGIYSYIGGKLDDELKNL